LSDTIASGVLITRPEPAATETARMLQARGFETVLAPMLLVQPHQWPAAQPRAQAILVTSANALQAATACDRDTPVLAVGDATAARAAACGFMHVASAGKDAVALMALAAARLDPAAGALLLASGAGLGLDLAADLRKLGFRVIRRVAYSATAARELPAPAMAALASGQIRHAMFFSAASARAFVACITAPDTMLREVEALAISAPTARALAPLPWRRIRVASHPNLDELVALLP